MSVQAWRGDSPLLLSLLCRTMAAAAAGETSTPSGKGDWGGAKTVAFALAGEILEGKVGRCG
jgi:hypothetical protein